MKVVTTIHLDSTSTPRDFRVAAERFVRMLEKGTGLKAAPHAPSLWVALFRKTMKETTGSPVEFRQDSMASEPIVVVHPGTRAEGEANKAKAVADGEWYTEAIAVVETPKK